MVARDLCKNHWYLQYLLDNAKREVFATNYCLGDEVVGYRYLRCRHAPDEVHFIKSDFSFKK